jgi:hypothetical protein
MKQKIISERCWKANQSWYYEKVIAFASNTRSFKLKVDIRRNAYDDQSHARVYQWDGTKWQLVVKYPIRDCVCQHLDYTMMNVTADSFSTDTLYLLKEALQIVGE